ncbi:hypothetical protein O0I10_001960 [Lichtheimia ornata]|uniref:Uncharacterized protein n=1 Tax=Lichtheimia ornata TaxID=688661 RepID=A0AAD7VCN2_9FUNG|nr:uncharacterized protein O0I10_001960 [Lichtheimia ornata]KAJ8662267.1 hypothetical protein O0I10_001960 [Lichtheimia ornata]
MTTSSVLPPLSLKRIRSHNTFRTASDQHRQHPSSSTNESPSRLSKFKSSLSIITKFKRPFTSHSPPSPPLTPPQHDAQQPQPQQRTKWRHRWSQHFDKRRLSSILSYGLFESEKQHDKYPFANDIFYEHERYRRASRSHSRLDLKTSTVIATSDSSNDDRHVRQNAQTMPPTPSPLPSPMMDDDDDMGLPWQQRDNHSSNKAPPASILVKRGDDSVLSNMSTTAAATTKTTKTRNRARSKSSSSTHSRRGHHHIRQKSSSNITVNSEDLTAKEFADIAGIRILDDASLSCCDNDAIMHTSSTSTRSSLQGRDYSHHRSMRSAASCSLLRPTPHIWDAEFWSNPDASSSKSTTTNNNNHHHHDGNSIKQQQQEWGRRRSTSNDSSRSRSAINNCVIKKGRFEICLETAESTEALVGSSSNASSVGCDEQCIPKIVTTDMDQQ